MALHTVSIKFVKLCFLTTYIVCAQDKYTDAGQPWYPTSLWQFEEAARPTSGEQICSL